MTERFRPITFGNQLKKMEVGGFILTETWHAPSLLLPKHDHECPNINFTINGSFREIIGRHPQECAPASILVKPAGEVHANQYGTAGAHCLIIEVGTNRLQTISRESNLFDVPNHIRGGLLSSFAKRIYKEFRQTDSASELIIEGLVLEMLGEVTRRRMSEGSATPPRWLREAKDLLHEHFARPLNLSGIALFVGVTPTHLARMFRRYYGCTAGDYVRRLRLEYAARELTETERPLSEIGIAAGFYDQSHFTHAFKQHTNLPPAEFRAAARMSKGITKKS